MLRCRHDGRGHLLVALLRRADQQPEAEVHVRMRIARALVGFIVPLACGWLAIQGAGVKAAGTTYHLDCLRGADTNGGTTPSTAWRSLGKVNAFAFSPGDTLAIARGSTCSGQLWPKGSGSSDAPIAIA